MVGRVEVRSDQVRCVGSGRSGLIGLGWWVKAVLVAQVAFG